MNSNQIMTKYKSEKPYTLHYKDLYQNYTLAFKDLQTAITRANELKCPVYDENKKLVYNPMEKRGKQMKSETEIKDLLKATNDELQGTLRVLRDTLNSSIDDTSEKINTIKALYPLIMFYKDKIKTLEFILND